MVAKKDACTPVRCWYEHSLVSAATLMRESDLGETSYLTSAYGFSKITALIFWTKESKQPLRDQSSSITVLVN